MQLSAKFLAGSGWFLLNVIRVMNLICFLAVIGACGVMMAKMIMLSQFYFFDFAGHIITAFICIFLFISELDVFRSFFSRQWPLLSSSYGLEFLGVVMMAIGVSILGSLNKPATSKSSLGLPFWQLVMGAGCLLLSLGFINILITFVFRNTATNQTPRQVRSLRAAAAPIPMSNSNPFNITGMKAVSDIPTTTTSVPRPTRFSTRFSKWASHLGVGTTTAPAHPELPSYRTSPVPSSHYSERHSMESSATEFKYTGPLGMNPHLSSMSRPESVVHAS